MNKEFLKNGIHPRPSSIFQKQKFRFSSSELNEWQTKQRDKKITAYNTAYLATQKGLKCFFKGMSFLFRPYFRLCLGGQSMVFRNKKEPANIQVLFNKFGENIRYAETLGEIQKILLLFYNEPPSSFRLNNHCSNI